VVETPGLPCGLHGSVIKPGVVLPPVAESLDPNNKGKTRIMIRVAKAKAKTAIPKDFMVQKLLGFCGNWLCFARLRHKVHGNHNNGYTYNCCCYRDEEAFHELFKFSD
jgi:hypothetical protein